MISRVNTFFNSEIDQDLAVEQIEQETAKLLCEYGVDWDEMETEEDQEEYIKGELYEMSFRYLRYLWEYEGHGDYDYEEQQNKRLSRMVEKWVNNIQGQFNLHRVINMIEERMIG
jgi:hypothetical protein